MAEPLTPAERAAIDESKQCEQLVSGERCVLVLNHRGACVKPLPRQDMSDVIRHRLLADRYAEAHEKLAALEAERDQARADLKRIADRLCGEDEAYAAKVARLDAMERAARAWARLRAVARDPQTAPDVWWQNGKALIVAEATLAAAVAALPGVPLPGAEHDAQQQPAQRPHDERLDPQPGRGA